MTPQIVLEGITNMWWDIVMDDWNLDERTLGKWHPKLLEGITNNGGLTFGVGEPTLCSLHLLLSKTIRNGDIKYHI